MTQKRKLTLRTRWSSVHWLAQMSEVKLCFWIMQVFVKQQLHQVGIKVRRRWNTMFSVFTASLHCDAALSDPQFWHLSEARITWRPHAPYLHALQPTTDEQEPRADDRAIIGKTRIVKEPRTGAVNSFRAFFDARGNRPSFCIGGLHGETPSIFCPTTIVLYRFYTKALLLTKLSQRT